MQRGFTEKAVFIAALFIFTAAGSLLLWRESSQVNLKSGMELYDKENPASAEVLRGGLKKNPNNYRLRYGLAMALQKEAFSDIQNGAEAKGTLLEARKNLNAALALRTDPLDYRLLAENYLFEGKFELALAYHNAAFFLSQNVKELERWKDLRSKQSDTARALFTGGKMGMALMMAFNEVTGFTFPPERSEAGNFLSAFFLSIPPEKWIGAGNEMKPVLTRFFNMYNAQEKENINRSLKEHGFAFLAEFLTSR